MTKLETYSYIKGKAKLEFNFPKDEDILKNKHDFYDLMIEAIAELSKEFKQDVTVPTKPFPEGSNNKK